MTDRFLTSRRVFEAMEDVESLVAALMSALESNV
jgi:hypothetical protein